MKNLFLTLFALVFLAGGPAAKAGGNADLSVKLIHAEGKIFYNQTFVTWSTEFEKVPCEFIIEASMDAQTWIIRGRAHSKGRPDQFAEYSFVDTRDDKLQYYRIRELDTRGSTVLSEFEPDNYSINVSLKEFKVQNERVISLEYKVDQDQKLMVRIYNKIGQQVVTRLMPFEKAGEYIYSLDVSDLPAGNYLLVVTQVLLDKSVAEQQFTLK